MFLHEVHLQSYIISRLKETSLVVCYPADILQNILH